MGTHWSLKQIELGEVEMQFVVIMFSKNFVHGI
jgi:hypothetical protein